MVAFTVLGKMLVNYIARTGTAVTLQIINRTQFMYLGAYTVRESST